MLTKHNCGLLLIILTEPEPNQNGEDSTTIVIVVVVVVVVLLVVVAILGVYFIKKKSAHKRVAPSPVPDDPQSYSRPSSPRPNLEVADNPAPQFIAPALPPGQVAGTSTDYMTVVNENENEDDLSAPVVYKPPPMDVMSVKSMEGTNSAVVPNKSVPNIPSIAVVSSASVSGTPKGSVTNVQTASAPDVADAPSDVTEVPAKDVSEDVKEVPVNDDVTSIASASLTPVPNVTTISVSDANEAPNTSTTDLRGSRPASAASRPRSAASRPRSATNRPSSRTSRPASAMSTTSGMNDNLNSTMTDIG